VRCASPSCASHLQHNLTTMYRTGRCKGNQRISTHISYISSCANRQVDACLSHLSQSMSASCNHTPLAPNHTPSGAFASCMSAHLLFYPSNKAWLALSRTQPR
jgi:hypothetical protein